MRPAWLLFDFSTSRSGNCVDLGRKSGQPVKNVG
jgi:hypothetical protein